MCVPLSLSTTPDDEAFLTFAPLDSLQSSFTLALSYQCYT